MAIEKDILHESFLGIGLDKKRATDTLKNEKTSELLFKVIQEAGCGKGTSRAVGNLLYTIATEFSSGSLDWISFLAKYVGDERICSRPQLLAAFSYASKTSFDLKNVEEFEKGCGVGVVVSVEEIEAVAKDICGSHSGSNLGVLMGMMKKKLPWGNPKLFKNVLDKYLKKENEDKEKKEKEEPKEEAKEKEKMKQINSIDEKFVMKEIKGGHRIVIKECCLHENKLVEIFGWASHVRQQGKNIFIDLRDSTGYLQCVISGKMSQLPIAEEIKRECSLKVVGKLFYPPGKHKIEGYLKVPVELQVEYYEIVGKTDPDFDSKVRKDSEIPIQLDQRHLVLRGKYAASMLKVRSLAIQCFRDYYFENDYFEVTPPTIVQTQCEGGSELFEVKYFDEIAYLTQSSQLYLESVLPSLGNVFCLTSSYRAEKSKTRRHIAEFSHLEAEMPFINFEDLLNILEDLVVSVCENIWAKGKYLIEHLNPDFRPLKKPFVRMTYRDAIKYCREHNIYKDEDLKTHFEEGDDIPEKPERQMTDMIGKPVFLIKFPVHMKAFYMKKCDDDPTVTESVDLLLPGVGEIIGSSIRIHDYDELMAAYAREKIDPSPYYWFTDQRKYGTSPHGGYGLGIERFLMFICKGEHVRNFCLYPRLQNRCQP